MIASLTLRELCTEWLEGQAAPSATLEDWLVEDMARRCGQAAVNAWRKATAEAGQPVDPYPFLEPAEGRQDDE